MAPLGILLKIVYQSTLGCWPLSTSHIAVPHWYCVLQILLNRVEGEDCAWTTEDNRVGLDKISSTIGSQKKKAILRAKWAVNKSVLAHKRRWKQNPPPKGVKWGKGKEKGDPKKITASECVKAYPHEEFCVSNTKLFCRACREELATKKSSFEYHIKSQKHMNGKKKLAVKNKEDADIVQALKAYDSEVHPVDAMTQFMLWYHGCMVSSFFLYHLCLTLIFCHILWLFN